MNTSDIDDFIRRRRRASTIIQIIVGNIKFNVYCSRTNRRLDRLLITGSWHCTYTVPVANTDAKVYGKNSLRGGTEGSVGGRHARRQRKSARTRGGVPFGDSIVTRLQRSVYVCMCVCVCVCVRECVKRYCAKSTPSARAVIGGFDEPLLMSTPCARWRKRIRAQASR